MITLDPRQAALDAVAASPARPATAILFDSPDIRLLVFRIAPGQRVAPNQNPSTVTLTVLSGEGLVSGRDGELHLLATITPRPGARTSPAALAHAEAV